MPLFIYKFRMGYIMVNNVRYPGNYVALTKDSLIYTAILLSLQILANVMVISVGILTLNAASKSCPSKRCIRNKTETTDGDTEAVN